MKNYDLETEAKDFGGKVWEQQYDDIKYLLAIGIYYHPRFKAYLMNGEVRNFDYGEVPEDTTIDTLNLTWLDTFDRFILDDSEQYKTIKKIIVNVENLNGSLLPISGKHELIEIVVNRGNPENRVERDESLLAQIRLITKFLVSNEPEVKEISLVGYSPLEVKIIELYAKAKGFNTNIHGLKEENKKNTLKK